MHPTSTTHGRALTALALVAVLTGIAGGCGSKDKNNETVSSTQPVPTTSIVAVTTTTLPPAEVEPDATVAVIPYFLRDGRVGPGQPRFARGPAVARAALDALIAGPADVDKAAGLNTAIARSVKVNNIEIADGVATVDFNRAFETANTRPQVAQVVYTLTQFSTVDKVKFLIDGEPNGATGVAPIGRADLEDVTPGVFVENPTPGQVVGAGFTFAGTANTFEANVPWSVEDSSGTDLAHGATTATSGTGQRGTFETTISVPGYKGPAVLVTWLENMETGAQEQVSRIPIEIGG